VRECAFVGVAFYDGGGGRVRASVVAENGVDGISVQGVVDPNSQGAAARPIQIEGCTVCDNPESGLYFYDAACEILVTHNRVLRNGNGVSVEDIGTAVVLRDNTLGHSIEAGIYVSKGATARCEGGTLRGNGLAGGYVDESAHLTLVEQTIESNREAGVLVMSGGHGRVLKSCLRWNGLANLSVLHLGARCDVVSHPALALCTEVECERRVILFL
jgi:nitrous oxidase accessory protein NosD